MSEDIQELDPADAEPVAPGDLDEITTTAVVARPSAPSRAASMPPPLPGAASGIRPSSAPPLPTRSSAPPLPGRSSAPPLPQRASAPSRVSPQAPLATLSDLRRKLATVSAEAKEAADHRDRLKVGILQREDRIKELEAQLEQRVTQIADPRLGELENRVRELEGNSREADSRLVEREARIRELEDRAREAETRVAAREDRAQELEGRLRQREQEISRLRAQLEEASRTPDDLTRLPGLGAGFERALRAAGVHSFAQIAAWQSEDVERIAREIKTSPSRIDRAGWIEHARRLLGPENL